MTEENRNEVESNQQVTRQKFEEEIILKAWKDPEYKKRLLESPKEVFQEELQKIRPEATLPEDFKVFIHEESPNAVHMTLPTNEVWLENASGGDVILNPGLGVVTPIGGVLIPAICSANVLAAANITNNVNISGSANVLATANFGGNAAAVCNGNVGW